MDMILDWIRCPMIVFRKKNIGHRVYDYESLLRTMLLNTMKAGYRDMKSSGSLDLEHHVPDIWEYFLKSRKVPNPLNLIRDMNEFCSMRSRYLEQIDKRYRDSTGLLNVGHWWDTGLIFDEKYFSLRDRINKNQYLLGFPDWNSVKSYYREYEYQPVSLADTYCDYMNGIRLFSRRKILPGNIRFDVQAYLELEDILLAVRFDILWQRKSPYKAGTRSLKPGLIAEMIIPCSAYDNADRIYRERMILKDVRMPLIGAEYKDSSGSRIQVDSICCCTLPSITETKCLKEDSVKYDAKSRKYILALLNRYGIACLKSAEEKLFVPHGLIKNGVCASCSFLKDCLENKLIS